MDKETVPEEAVTEADYDDTDHDGAPMDIVERLCQAARGAVGVLRSDNLTAQDIAHTAAFLETAYLDLEDMLLEFRAREAQVTARIMDVFAGMSITEEVAPQEPADPPSAAVLTAEPPVVATGAPGGASVALPVAVSDPPVAEPPSPNGKGKTTDDIPTGKATH